jgi:hypothetical protein
MGALHGRNDVPDSQALQCTRCSDAWAKMISGLGVVATRHPETFAVLGIAHFYCVGQASQTEELLLEILRVVIEAVSEAGSHC